MSAIQLSTTKVKYGFLCLNLLAQEIVALLKLAIRVSFRWKVHQLGIYSCLLRGTKEIT